MAKSKKKKTPMAELADRHELYENSVQNVEFEVEFITNEFNVHRGRECRSLREDFCGTAQAAVEWVKQHPENTAIGVDIDVEVLQWGREHHIEPLSAEQQARISVVQDDVLTVETPKVDALAASNFSYWLFESRETLLDYFKRAYAALKEDGVLFLDAYGGYEAHQELQEETEYDDFTYVWDQHYYNPYNHHMDCYIHFHFPDGSKMEKAFSYSWRLWSLPEIRELLTEAGFKQVVTYAEGWDEDEEEGNGEWTPTENFDADPGWLAYMVVLK